MGAIVLQAVFSFHGRMGRVAFLGWSVAVTLLIVVVAFAFIAFGAVLARSFSVGGAGALALGILIGGAAVIIAIWISFALQVKRIRDMGFIPWPWVISITAVMLADQFLFTHYTQLRFFPPLAEYTPFGGFLTAVYTIVLLLWPSADESQDIAVAPRVERTPNPSPARRTVVAQPSHRAEFGLRSRS
jgi:uncharacterized membrane protein YhaH (DUF805 family)